jgi:hypothetical protein
MNLFEYYTPGCNFWNYKRIIFRCWEKSSCPKVSTLSIYPSQCNNTVRIFVGCATTLGNTVADTVMVSSGKAVSPEQRPNIFTAKSSRDNNNNNNKS